MKIIPQDCRKRRKRREGKDRKALGAEEKMATEDSRKEKKIGEKDCKKGLHLPVGCDIVQDTRERTNYLWP